MLLCCSLWFAPLVTEEFFRWDLLINNFHCAFSSPTATSREDVHIKGFTFILPYFYLFPYPSKWLIPEPGNKFNLPGTNLNANLFQDLICEVVTFLPVFTLLLTQRSPGPGGDFWCDHSKYCKIKACLTSTVEVCNDVVHDWVFFHRFRGKSKPTWQDCFCL